MRLLHQKRCFCGCKLEKATTIIAVTAIVYGSLVCGTMTFAIYEYSICPVKGITIACFADNDTNGKMVIVSMGYIVYGYFVLTSSLALLFGVLKKKHQLIRMWVVAMVILTIIKLVVDFLAQALIASVQDSLSLANSIMGIVIGQVLEAYLVLVVFSYYRLLCCSTTNC